MTGMISPSFPMAWNSNGMDGVCHGFLDRKLFETGVLNTILPGGSQEKALRAMREGLLL
jgi:hypothetical protein